MIVLDWGKVLGQASLLDEVFGHYGLLDTLSERIEAFIRSHDNQKIEHSVSPQTTQTTQTTASKTA